MPSSASPSKPPQKSSRSSIGAPAQHNQPSRKGKKAWRKNVDIQAVEAGMEELRTEERTTGTYLHKQDNSQLFVVDVKGDEKIRHIVPKFKATDLTSTRILKERSAVPAVFSRPSTATKKRKANLTAEEKDRLLRISKRPRKGPFNSVVDPTEFGSGSASMELSAAVKQSGGYDAWAQEEPVEVKDGLETVQPKKIKPPQHSHPRDAIEVPAIVAPHAGTSYNPPAVAHTELLQNAVEIEEKREAEAIKLAKEKAKFDRARETAVESEPGGRPGMLVPDIVDDADDDEEAEVIPKQMPQRKTKAQRNKAARLLAEKRALADKARRKRELAIVNDIRQLRKSANETRAFREQQQTGKKLGKHRVPVGEVDVQLGEDLSETLRELKPEGNLFRDRFTSLQQRALIEPRVPVLPKRRKHRMVEYEKHAWKRFDREQQ
ncbi:Ribosome biogenesis protein NOP53 [Mycena chlorophos]|uniref:Ribosome biogenesis protein NOP53 n=1 Tax=Mycena chlorophos TaxID=658473 RepID=A0A8H6VTF8_MYCCL|nr:Ribosome biogenesis protein NOP53 [Mycena chlorophos]